MTIDPTVWYHIVNANSNRMLEVPAQATPDARLRDGVFILQGDTFNANDSSPWALWQIVPIANDTYNIYNKGSGRCLVVQQGRMDAGAPCWQFSVMPQRLQEEWTIADIGNGNLWIRNVKSGRFIEIQNSGTSNGDICQQYDNTPPDRRGAQWQLKPTTISTIPKLTKAQLTGNEIHHNQGVKSPGTLTGDNLLIGCSVRLEKGNGVKIWTGVIEDNSMDSTLGLCWKFSVEKKSESRSPIEEDTVTATVTNPQQQPSSPPLPASPQPTDVP